MIHSQSYINEDNLAAVDPDIAAAIQRETQRQQDHVELIASENFTHPAVMEANGCVMTNKYAEGYPAKRYYGGCDHVDEAENLAIARARELFGAEHANVQPHSGSQANQAVYASVIEPGDKILTMTLSDGGHLTHGHPANFSGKLYQVVNYGVDPENGRIDYEDLAATAEAEKPKLITTGASAYPRIIDFERMGTIARNCGALLLADIAHIAGLVGSGLRSGTLKQYEASVIQNVLALEKKSARDVMTPRPVVFTLGAQISTREAAGMDELSKHSRIPIFDVDQDDLVGVVHRRDVLAAVADDRFGLRLDKMMRPLHFVVGSLPLDELLRTLLDRHQHLVAVIDEVGAFVGVVTLEDVLEELIGREIVDEFDEIPDLRAYAHQRRDELLRGQRSKL